MKGSDRSFVSERNALTTTTISTVEMQRESEKDEADPDPATGAVVLLPHSPLCLVSAARGWASGLQTRSNHSQNTCSHHQPHKKKPSAASAPHRHCTLSQQVNKTGAGASCINPHTCPALMPIATLAAFVRSLEYTYAANPYSESLASLTASASDPSNPHSATTCRR